MPSSATGYKRRRSIQESLVDLSTMREAAKHLASLKEELEGIQEAEAEMDAVMKHVEALDNILKKAPKQKLSFSSMNTRDLERLGVVKGRLTINHKALDHQFEKTSPAFKDEVSHLAAHLNDIYSCVTMDYEAGARIVLNAILLSLRKIKLKLEKIEVAILPELELTPTDGVKVVNKASGYELYLTGSTDYAVVQYEPIKDYRERLISAGGGRDYMFEISKGRLYLVEGKRQQLDVPLVSYRPEAVSQAIAVAVVNGQEEIRFCLSNGKTWIFYVLKQEEGVWAYYESAAFQLGQASDVNKLRRIIILLVAWLGKTTTSNLYQLDRSPQIHQA